MQHIAQKFPDARVTGTFTVEPGTEIFGDLKLRGPHTSLDLRHDEFFSTHRIPDQCVTGILHDLSKVTLLDCHEASHGTASRHGKGYTIAQIWPFFILFGDAHINPNDETIQSFAFQIDDADILFHDYDAFGKVIDARPFIEQIVKANTPERQIAIGPNPHIHYFTGKSEIIRTDTCLGTVTASHSLSWGGGTPAGIRLDSKIVVKVALKQPCRFRDTIEKLLPLLRFFELLIGRPQNIERFWVRLPDGGEDRINILDVYWSHPPQRDPRHELAPPRPMDVLISPIHDADTFSSVLANWLEQDVARRSARVRFSQTFAQQRHYPSDRIVAAANMFDILPANAAPKTTAIGPDVLAAKDASRELFRVLPPSLEREALLQALGRIGYSSLKHKIRYRARPIISAIGHQFPDLELAIDEAVNCRHYFVHGGGSSFNYDDIFGTTVFLTNTLEFVFGVSDLIDAGWNISNWGIRGSTLSHPFASYRHTYAANISELRRLAAPSSPDI